MIGGGVAAALSVLLFAGQGAASLVRWVFALGAVAVTVGGVWAIRRFAEDSDSVQIRAERGAALLIVCVLGVCAVVSALIGGVHGDEKPGRGESPRRVVESEPAKDDAADRAKKSVPSDSRAAARPDSPKGKEGPPDMPQQIVDRVNGLIRESDALAKGGEREQADERLEKAISLIDAESPWSLYQRGQVVGTLARLRADMDRVGEAMDLFDAHIEKLMNAPKPDPLSAATFHDNAGEMLGNQGRFAESLERFQRAVALRQNLSVDPRMTASSYAKIAVSYARLSDKQKAADAVQTAEDLLKGLQPPDEAGLQKLASIRKEYNLK